MAYSDDDDIITLTTKDGEDIDFIEIAGINYRSKFYLILQPVELLDGMNDDEALVFRVTRGNNGDSYDLETNDSIVDAVFKEYNRLLTQQNNGGKKLKKSQGMGKVFGAAKVVAKTTMWIVKLIICLAITLIGAVFIIGAIMARTELGLIGFIILGALGLLGLVLGIRGIIRLVKNRKFH